MHRAPPWSGPLVAALVLAGGAVGCSSTSTTSSTVTSGASSASVTAGSSAPGTGTSSATGAGTTQPGSASSFHLTSSAFADGGTIPQMYTCQGSAGSPPLAWTGVPAGTTSLALVVVDPDAPVPNGFTHWVKADIDPSTTSLPAASSGYTPPCPPSGTHHYIFTLYAFGAAPPGTDRAGIEGAGDVVGKTVLTGLYAKQ